MRIKIGGIEKRWAAPMRPEYSEGLAYGTYLFIENGPDKGACRVKGNEHFFAGKGHLMARDTMAVAMTCETYPGAIADAREKLKGRFVSGADFLVLPDGSLASVSGDYSAEMLRGFGTSCGGRAIVNIKNGMEVKRYAVASVCAFCESSQLQVTHRFSMTELVDLPPVAIETLPIPSEEAVTAAISCAAAPVVAPEKEPERPQEKRGPGRPRSVIR